MLRKDKVTHCVIGFSQPLLCSKNKETGLFLLHTVIAGTADNVFFYKYKTLKKLQKLKCEKTVSSVSYIYDCNHHRQNVITCIVNKSCIKYSTSKYQYQYQYQWSKYQYKYQYLACKYKYKYQH